MEFDIANNTATSIIVADPKRLSKEKRLLRKAAYWLNDYANCFRGEQAPGVARFRDKLRKIAAECRKTGR